MYLCWCNTLWNLVLEWNSMWSEFSFEKNKYYHLNIFFFLVLCPLGWLNYEIYCYYNSQSAATWNNSRAYCQKFGADLLVIRNQAEFDFIKPQAAAIIGNRKRAFIGYYTLSSSSRSFLLHFCSMKIVCFLLFSWIFLQWSAGLFSWLDSSLPTFTGNHLNQPWWCGPQPTFSFSSSYTPNVQGCGALQLESNGDICMNDWWFSELLPFICKKSFVDSFLRSILSWRALFRCF